MRLSSFSSNSSDNYRPCVVGTTICVDSTLESDLPISLLHVPRLVLTILARLSITTHYYKITDIIGALSASPFRPIFHPHLTWHRPEAQYYCDVDFDPFTVMRENKKTYSPFFLLLACRTSNPTLFNSGFVLTLPEEPKSIDSLWPTVKGASTLPSPSTCAFTSPLRTQFIAQYPQYIVPDNAMNFLSDNGGDDYNNCLCATLFIPARSR